MLAPWKPLMKRAGSGSVIQCTDPSIRIRLNMSRIRNTAYENVPNTRASNPELFNSSQLSDKVVNCWRIFFTFDVGAHAAAVPKCDVTEATVSGPDGLLILKRMSARNPARARATQHLKQCCRSGSVEFVCLLDPVPSIINQKKYEKPWFLLFLWLLFDF